MLKTMICALLCAAVTFVGAGCKKNAAGPPGAPPPPKVTVVKPEMYSVQKYYEYNGYLDAVETNEIRARVKGFLNEVHFKGKEGGEVEKNALLYTIDPRQYQANVAKSKADIAKAVADMANAGAQIKLAEANYERFKASGSGSSKSEVDQAQATLDSNKALYNVAAANKASAEAALQSAELDLSYTEIRAPISGRISRTLVTQGNLVGQTDATLLTTIVSVDPLYVYFDVPEKDDVAQRKRQAKANGPTENPKIPIEIGIATDEGYPHKGVLDFQENKADTGTGTVRVRGIVPNSRPEPGKDRLLKPGLYARLRVPNGTSTPQLTIPEEALMTGQEGRFVYVIGDENKVQKRTVTVGAPVWRVPELNPNPDPKAKPVPMWLLDDQKPVPKTEGQPPESTKVPARSIIAIEKGLEPGDQVIINGLQKARPGAPVTPDLWKIIPPPPEPAKK
jgi:RND family efflux transporter MFP subunit